MEEEWCGSIRHDHVWNMQQKRAGQEGIVHAGNWSDHR